MKGIPYFLPFHVADADAGLSNLFDARHPIDPAGDVGEETRRGPVRHEHDVGREQVRQAARGGGADLGLVIIGDDVGSYDVVLVRRVVGLDQLVGACLRRRAGPQRQLRSVIDAHGVGSAG